MSTTASRPGPSRQAPDDSLAPHKSMRRKLDARQRRFADVTSEPDIDALEPALPSPEAVRSARRRILGACLLIAGAAAIGGGFLAILDQPAAEAAAQSPVPLLNPGPVYAWLAGSIVLVSLGGLLVALAKGKPAGAGTSK